MDRVVKNTFKILSKGVNQAKESLRFRPLSSSHRHELPRLNTCSPDCVPTKVGNCTVYFVERFGNSVYALRENFRETGEENEEYLT